MARISSSPAWTLTAGIETIGLATPPRVSTPFTSSATLASVGPLGSQTCLGRAGCIGGNECLAETPPRPRVVGIRRNGVSERIGRGGSVASAQFKSPEVVPDCRRAGIGRQYLPEQSSPLLEAAQSCVDDSERIERLEIAIAEPGGALETGRGVDQISCSLVSQTKLRLDRA